MNKPNKPATRVGQAVRPSPPADQKTHRKKSRLFIGVGLVLITGLLALGYSYFIEPRRLVINDQELKIANIGPALDGMKIVAISDIHGGSNGIDEAKLRSIVETVNAQGSDLVVLLGDYVSQTGEPGPDGRRPLKMPVETVAANLAGIKAKQGVFAVLGNHDGWFDDANVAAALNGAGIRVLNGEVAVIERNGARLRILGLEDQLKIRTWEGYSADVRRLLAPTAGTGDVLVLSHSPDVAPIITGSHSISDDLKLMLAGHTHGGQVWLPILGRPIVPSSYGQKFAAGHAREDGLDVFVTTGIGTSILPFRFMVAPEIAVITLKTK